MWKLLSIAYAPHYIVLASSLALLGAYISQYGFGMEPCILCLYQRIPYWIALGFGSLMLWVKRNRRCLLLILCMACFITGATLALYHVGVEQHIFTMTEGCGDAGTPDDLDSLQALVLATPHVPCDKPQFIFLGLSMAAWNAFYSFALACMLGYMLYVHRKASL